MASSSDGEKTLYRKGVSTDGGGLIIKEEIIDIEIDVEPEWMVKTEDPNPYSDSTSNPHEFADVSECGSPFKNDRKTITKSMVDLIHEELVNQNEDEDDHLSDSGASSEEDCVVMFDDFQDDEFDVSDFVMNGASDDEHQQEPAVKREKPAAEWSDVPFLNGVSQNPPSWNSAHRPKVIWDKSSLHSEVACFSLLFDDFIVDHLVACVNDGITQKAVTHSSVPKLGPTNPVELRALFGLLFLKGALRNSHLSFSDLFSEIFGPPLFRATMSKNRMTFLLRALRFNPKGVRLRQNIEDKFSPVREFWNAFCDNCAKCYSPSEHLCVGNNYLDLKGKCPFRIIRPRSHKAALNIISIYDAQTFYFCGGVPYIGGNQQPKQYLLELLERVSRSDRNVTMGNWFSSFALAEELFQLGFTMVGALRKTEKNFPTRLITSRKLPLLTSRFAYQRDKALIAFNEHHGKNLVLLSTMRNSGAVNPRTGRPDLLELYEKTILGPKIADDQCKLYSTAMPSNRWTMTIFFRALDLAGLNSFILFSLTTNSYYRRADFLKRLAFSLTEPLMKQTLYNTNIPKIVRQNVCQVLGLEPRKHIVEASFNCSTQSVLAGSANSRRRCWFCDSRKDRKTSKYCECCYLPICREHTVSVMHCQLCAHDPEKSG